MTDELQTQITAILQQCDEQRDVAEDLLPLVYDNLRAIAGQRMKDERSGHTLDATALVHEAYMKLVGHNEMSWQSRGHFFAVAAEAMRRILIDHARRRDSKKRGSGKTPAPLSVIDLASDTDPNQVLALDEAISKLEREDPRAASVVMMRFFAGLSVEETAEALNISERTVMREWTFARAKLFQMLNTGTHG